MTWTTRPRSELGALRVLTAGAEGPGRETVVLLHGVGLRAEAWAAQIDHLAARFHVIAPDLPGHGESPAFDARPDLMDFAERIVDGLSDRVWLAGHSMGALIALEIAVRRPDLVRGVAALNAVFRRSPEAAARVAARAAALDGVAAVDASEPLDRWFSGRASAEAEACGRWLSSVDPAGYRAAYSVFAAVDGPGEAALQGLEVPALFLTGDGDPNSTPAMARAMAALAPQGIADIRMGAAHMLPMTHAEEVNARLETFFTEGRT